MRLSKKAARLILESAAFHIYQHVKVDDATGLVKRESDADWQAWKILINLLK